MFSWYMYLIVSLIFSRLGFWSENLFLIALFPHRCLLVPLNANGTVLKHMEMQVFMQIKGTVKSLFAVMHMDVQAYETVFFMHMGL